MSLPHSAHVKNLLAMLRCAVNHADEIAWMRYATLWPRIGEATAGRWIGAMDGATSVEEGLQLVMDRFGEHQLLDGVRVVASTATAADAVRAASDLLSPLQAGRYKDWERRRSDYELLERMAQRHRTIEGFLDTYALEPVSTSEARRAKEMDAVTLITVHSAKGTEAPVCYVPRLEPGMYPHIRSVGDPDQIEEERRVLYVAITRAQDELILTRTLQVLDETVYFGGAKPSYFLTGLPAELVEHGPNGLPELKCCPCPTRL